MPLSSVAGELSFLFAMLYYCDFSQCLMKWAFDISIWSSKHLNHQRLCLLILTGQQLTIRNPPLFPEGGAITQVFHFPSQADSMLHIFTFHLFCRKVLWPPPPSSMLQGQLWLQELDWICNDWNEWDTLWGVFRVLWGGWRQWTSLGTELILQTEGIEPK